MLLSFTYGAMISSCAAQPQEGDGVIRAQIMEERGVVENIDESRSLLEMKSYMGRSYTFQNFYVRDDAQVVDVNREASIAAIDRGDRVRVQFIQTPEGNKQAFYIRIEE